MSPFADDAAVNELRGTLREARYLLARWRKLGGVLAGIEARARSIEVCLALESRLVDEEVRLLALRDAGADTARLEGELKAERARLAARLDLEKRAWRTTRQLFDIRAAR